MRNSDRAKYKGPLSFGQQKMNVQYGTLGGSEMGEEEAHVRKRGKARLLTCGGVFLLLGAVFAGLLFACLDVPVQSQRLADGGAFSLVGYTTPDRPELLTGAPLFRQLEPLLSSDIEERLGVRHLKHPGGQLALWIKRTPPSGFDATTLNAYDHRYRTYAMSLTQAHVAKVSDEVGRLSSLPFPKDFLAVRNISFEPGVSEICVTTLPRRGRELIVSIYSFDKDPLGEPLATFHIANPYARDYPVWKPRPLPAREPCGDLEVELISLRNGPATDRYGKKIEEGYFSDAMVQIRRGGLPCADWQPDLVRMQDATGNDWESAPHYGSRGVGRYRVVTPGNLWDEPAWKLTIRLARIKGFSPGETYRQRVVMPPSGSHRVRRAKGYVSGLSVEVASVTAKDARVPFGSGTVQARRGAVLVRVNDRLKGEKLRLVGVSAFRFQWSGQYPGSYAENGKWLFWLPDKTPSGPINLTFAPHRTQQVVFLAPSPKMRAKSKK
jgi:hypothetical protein